MAFQVERKHPVTLEEYRRQIIDRLKDCADVQAARNALADAELILANNRLTPLTQDKFWEELYQDLDVLIEEAKFMPDREAGMKLWTVVLAAQAGISRYRGRATSAD